MPIGLRNGLRLAALVGVLAALASPALSQARAAHVGIIEPPLQSPSTWTYDPDELTVKLGTTVEWTNTGAVVHTVTVTDETAAATGVSFDSGDIPHGETFSYTFDSAGTFAYYCVYHPWMAGKIIVVP
jgi:plastocyanin